MKSNEKIAAVSWFGLLVIYGHAIMSQFSIWHLLGIGTLGIISSIFLSWWGLTTFNEWTKNIDKKKS